MDAKKYVDNFQVKRIQNKVLKTELKAKFDLHRFIPAKVVCLEIPRLDLKRYLIDLFVFYLSFCIMLRSNVNIFFIFFLS